jgi:putative drug exporter of the RND superfamily
MAVRPPTTRLAAIGSFTARRRRLVLLVWVLVVAGAAAFVPTFRGNLEGIGYETPGSESAAAVTAVRAHGGGAERAMVVATATGPSAGAARLRQALARAADELRDVDVVKGVGDVVVAADGRAALLPVELDGTTADRQDGSDVVQERIDTLAPRGIELDFTGISPLFADLIHLEERDLVLAEAVGVPLAFAVLLLVMGSLVSAALPIAVALAGLLTTLGLLGIVSLVSPFNIFVENVVAMIGLGVGIDYSMLIVRRFREERRAGDGDEAALARTMATAGRTVIFSGAAVGVCLLPLAFTGLPFFAETAVGAIAVLVVVVAAAITLLPAGLAALGDRIEAVRLPWSRRPQGGGRWATWARTVMQRPAPVLILGAMVLLAAASPALALKSGNDLNASALSDAPSGRALTALESHFGDVALSPFEIVATEPNATRAAVAVVRADDRFADVRSQPLADGATLLLAMPKVAVDSEAATQTVVDLREALAAAAPGKEILVAGYSAESLDFTDEMEAGTPLVIALALGLCFVVLMAVFRSPLLALKAILANLLSLAAAFGLVVLVFQEGLGEEVLGFTSPGYIQSWTPLTLFMIVFGLSMDYEVFMVSRIREEWERLGDTTEAVASGLARTGALVTSAAAIMVAIFGAFVLSTAPEIKQFGFALAVAVLIDATIVRASLVPAFMRIAGRWNWWIPGWLDRRLPQLHHG